MRRFCTSSLVLGLFVLGFGTGLSSQTNTSRPSGFDSPANAPHVLTTVAQIRALSAAAAAQGQPVELHATLTYYEPSDGIVFAQDATGGIYVVAPPHAPILKAGDVAVITGTTLAPNFAVNLQASQIQFERAGPMPKPVPVTWRDLMHSTHDCAYVSITGTVRSATVQLADAPSGTAAGGRRRYFLMDLQTAGGASTCIWRTFGSIDPIGLLDSLVRLDGVAGGVFDGAFRQTGAELWVSSARHMTVLKHPANDPAKLPLTKINHIMAGYSAQRREPACSRARQSHPVPARSGIGAETPDGQAVLVNSYEQSPLHMGQVVDVVGFPDPSEYSEVLSDGSVLPTSDSQR